MVSEGKMSNKEDKKESMNKEGKHQKPMKSLNSSDSFTGIEEVDVSLAPISPVEENEKYEERNQSLLLDGIEDEELCSNGSSSLGQKKRRLSVDQVRALEKDFEMENKLDPERKVRLAQELGLGPRQVAVWFQNRRARWKTKQLERDYGALKARHDALKLDVDALRGDKEALMAEIRELKSKLGDSAVTKMVEEEEIKAAGEGGRAAVFKDGTSDSDSSVVFNEEARPYSGVLLDQQCLLGTKSPCSSLLFEYHRVQDENSYMEEASFLNGDELCRNLFPEEQTPPSLSWCCAEGWE